MNTKIIPTTPGVIHYTPRRRPNIRAALIISGVCLLIAALLLLAYLTAVDMPTDSFRVWAPSGLGARLFFTPNGGWLLIVGGGK
jgi:hypothetical protein